MVITRLELSEQSKIKVYLDEEYAFFLYQRELDMYHLKEGMEIDALLYDEILENTIYHRAQEKALSILKFMDRTERELTAKLREAGYPECIIDKVIIYMKSYGYINDERYAANFIRSKLNTKSKLAIRTILLQKGIDRVIIDHVFEDEYDKDEQEDAELAAIRKAVAKKTDSPSDLPYEQKQKLIASLYRKGYEIDKIKKIIY